MLLVREWVQCVSLCDISYKKALSINAMTSFIRKIVQNPRAIFQTEAFCVINRINGLKQTRAEYILCEKSYKEKKDAPPREE